MKRFRFKLLHLLELRAFHEKRSELVLAEKAGACAVLEGRIAGNLESRARTIRERTGRSLSIPDFMASELYRARLDGERERLGVELLGAESERELARVEYLSRRRDREAVDKLRERREAEYYRLAAREETKALDDLVRRPAIGASSRSTIGAGSR
ncbi:MAG: flagellar export protein FliJ [Spirochaetota bacterium]